MLTSARLALTVGISRNSNPILHLFLCWTYLLVAMWQRREGSYFCTRTIYTVSGRDYILSYLHSHSRFPANLELWFKSYVFTVWLRLEIMVENVCERKDFNEIMVRCIMSPEQWHCIWTAVVALYQLKVEAMGGGCPYKDPSNWKGEIHLWGGFQQNLLHHSSAFPHLNILLFECF